MYILDTDFFIHAYRYDFPPDADHDGFWDWLDDLGQTHNIVIPEKVLEEANRGHDGLPELIKNFKYIKREPIKNAYPRMQQVIEVYGEMTEQELEKIEVKADPYLAAHALDLGGIVVTNEVSRPGIRKPVNKKIPDICNQLGVACIRYPRFIWDMQKA